ncbi:hypothetical protein QP027_01785 [Corynebacterium breve]|uniref:Secreted protein n=1 Tax=Corynebacterium breve TaxID=3049799 RepID=A0ABY8VHB6_9CORY|nr:hypothetical protein [Corynebacterium breve]WIM68155.1 hypothetical protein QP027_01785 [Corynebacterium breve]
MLKLTKDDKGWLGIVIALWLIALFALIFILPKGNVQSAPTKSLAAAVNQSTPAQGPAMATDMEIDLGKVYGDDYAGYMTLCSNEPPELVEAKKSVLEADTKISPDENYIMLLPADESSPVKLDALPADKFDLCPVLGGQPFIMQEPQPIQYPIPLHKENGKWTMGYRL